MEPDKGGVRRKISLVSALAIFLSIFIFAPTTPAVAENPARKILSGWIPYYSLKTSLPAAINNADLIKEVMPFWYTLKYDSKKSIASIRDLYTPANPSIPIAQPLASLRGAGFAIIPTITDGTDKAVLASLLAKPQSRTQIVKVITDLVIANNYDGIDLDFEGFAFVDGNSTWKKTAPSWAAFVKELAVSLHAQKKLLSVSTPYVLDPAGAQKGYYVYAWAAIASSIDRLRIMTYDYSVARAGPLGPITWTERTVQYAVSIMPASKVYVGIPGYGRDWVTAVSGVCPSNVASVIKAGAKAATFVMRDAQKLAATYGVVPQYNEQFGENTFTYQKVYNGTTAGGLATSCTATRVAWYQDAKGYALRASLVDKYRLGGLAAWTLGMEEPLAIDGIRTIAKSIAPDQVIATLATDTATLNYGGVFTLTGTFTIKDKSPLANEDVRIEGLSPGESTWRLLATVKTDLTGSFTKPLIVGRATSIRAVTAGSWERAEGVTNEVAISITRKLSITAPATVKRSESFTVTGTLHPRTVGTFITLESLVGGKWVPVGSAVPTDAQGAFTLAVPGQARGVLTLRVTAAAEVLYPISTSPAFSILIRSSTLPELVK